MSSVRLELLSLWVQDGKDIEKVVVEMRSGRIRGLAHSGGREQVGGVFEEWHWEGKRCAGTVWVSSAEAISRDNKTQLLNARFE